MDKYLVSLAFILLFLEGAWLAQDVNSTSSAQNNNSLSKPLGKIVKFKSQVKKRGADSLIWEQTGSEQNVFAYDSVLTMDQSTAEIILKGDSHITMNENTMVVVEPPPEGSADGPLRLRFKKGNLRTIAGVESQNVASGDYIIEATSKTQMNIRSTGDDKFEIEAVNGEVKILDNKTMQVAQVVQTGQSAQVTGAGVTKTDSAKNLVWKTPQDGEKFYTHTPDTPVNFQWEGDVSEITIGDKTQTVPPGQTTWTEKLPVGNYSVRLKVGTDSSFARVISVWNAPKIYLVSPVIRQRFKSSKPISFLWTQTPFVSKYILEISKDKDFSKLERTFTTDSVSTLVENLPDGELHWRVRGLDESGFMIPELYENIFYTLDKPLAAPKLKDTHIEDEEKEAEPQPAPTPPQSYFNILWNLILPQAHAEVAAVERSQNYSAEFQWEKVEGAKSYIIEISQSPDFRELLITGHSHRESYKWKNFPLGRFYWRVAGQDVAGDTGLFSETAYADLTRIPTRPIRPKPAPKNPEAVSAPKVPPPPVAVKAQPPPPPEPEYNDPWNFSFEGGAHGTYSLFKGGDFTATDVGVVFGDFRLGILPPARKYKFWTADIEFHLLALKARPASTFPFQDPLSTSTLRGTFVTNESFGFEVNQYLAFKRTDLESLGFQKLWAVGPVWQWIDGNGKYEDTYRGAILVGQTYNIDLAFKRTWAWGDAERHQWMVSPELRLAGGVTSNKDLWIDSGIYLWFGIRW